MFDVEAADVVEVLGQPEEIEVPGGVAHELGEDEGADAWHGDELGEGEMAGGFAGVEGVDGEPAGLSDSESAHQMTQASPMAPAAKNMVRQPLVRRTKPMSGGARTEPTAVPALMRPTAVERCSRGNPLGDDADGGGEGSALPHAEEEARAEEHAEVGARPWRRRRATTTA